MGNNNGEINLGNGIIENYAMIQLDIQSIIADTPPCIGGGGVYVARAILGYTETTPGDNKSLEMQPLENTTEGTVVVYPNPANDEFFVLLDGYTSGQKVVLAIYSLMGTPLLEKQIITGNEAVRIGNNNLSAGCYLLILKTADKTIYSNRLVIIK